MKTVWLESVDSTNSYIKSHAEVEPLTIYAALRQFAGRGQRGNIWESEPGRNLTISFWFEPEAIKPAAQFVISEAVALSLKLLLEKYGIAAKVKWPNDIYVEDKKICGILIENSIIGSSISKSIVGIGLNVNQLEFVSDAPNPVSMAKLLHRQFSLDEVAEGLGKYLLYNIGRLGEAETLHQEYINGLWRGDGNNYPFRDSRAGTVFHASIETVEASGHLILRDTSGRLRRYAFKEVEALL